MDGFSLKSRAVVFAICAGTVAFILALVATAGDQLGVEGTARALMVAIICGAMCWASAERSISATAAAIDAAIHRLIQASNGDLTSEIPDEVHQNVPQLSNAMGGLFNQLSTNLNNVQRLAMFDPVTHLPNRTNFRRSCERMLAQMPSDGCAALIFIDLDRFKAVNDTLGHASGDMLLGMVANRLRAIAERFAVADEQGEQVAPLIGRLAGDEFTIFFQHVNDVAEVRRIGNAILYALSETFDLTGNDVEIGASVGIALRPEHGRTLTELMRAADAAMYHAKGQGRGRVEFFSQELADQMADREKLEFDLRSAVERDEFRLVYQPQIDARDGRVVGAEALLRWEHPQGLRMPGHFIERAEETGLIVEIGDWVIGHVAGTIARWAALGIEQRMAVNISPRQLDHASFFRRLRDALREAGAPARLLELELTETLAMNCSHDVIDAVAELRADGATIAVDDFGTGYSNLARLRDMPVDRVKLDRSLIEHVTEREDARAIAQAVIGLIHGFGCEAVAEGIETVDQAEVLRVIGCDVLQGYVIARPMEEVRFLNWVGDQRLAAAG